MTQLALAQTRLFAKEGVAVTNLKLYPGVNRDTTVEEFSEQINKALSQIEAGEFEEVSYAD